MRTIGETVTLFNPHSPSDPINWCKGTILEFIDFAYYVVEINPSMVITVTSSFFVV